VLRHRAGFHQALVAHHPDSKRNIGELNQQKSHPEMAGHVIIANNPCANHRQQRAESIAPAQATPAHQVVNQGDVERRQHGKQQQLRNGQVQIGPEAQHIHDAQLHRAHQHIQADSFQAVSARTQKRQKHQRSKADAHQHGKIAIDMSGKILAVKAKREGPQDRGNNQERHNECLIGR